jgi:hypothetical protein
MQDVFDALTFDINWLETGLAIDYPLPEGLMVHKILPPYPDRSQGRHKIRAPLWPNAEHRRLVTTEHALRTEPNEVSWRPDYQDFAVARHALRVPMDPAEIAAAAAGGIDASSRSRRQVWSQLETRAEYDGATLLQTAGTYAAGFSAAVAAGDEWNGGANNPDPVAVIRADMETVRQRNGRYPNFVAMGKPTWDAFINNDKVIERMRGAQGADQTNRPITLLTDAAPWFAIDPGGMQIPELYVGQSSYWNETTETFVDIWADNYIVGINSPMPENDPQPFFGMTLQEQIAEIDGIPVKGVFGNYSKHPFEINEFYLAWYAHHVAKNDAAFLRTNVVQ